MEDLLYFGQEVRQGYSLTPFCGEVMCIGCVPGVAMPNAAFAITPINTRTIQHQGETEQPFLHIGIDLDKMPVWLLMTLA